jgi:hypothetical protein
MSGSEQLNKKLGFKRRLIHSRRLRMIVIGIPLVFILVLIRSFCTERQFNTFLLAFFGLIIMFLVYNFRKSDESNIIITEKNEEINRQKQLVEEQKILVDKALHELREKNKEVMESIHYAKRIQTALLPTQKYLEKKLTDKKSA